MQKTFLTILLVLSAICCMGESISLNLSVLKKGEKAERSVWLHNTVSVPIAITNIETGCVCTKASFDRKEIQPGDSTRIDLVFSAKDIGVFYKTISVTTTDQQCDMTVTLRGRVDK